MKISIWFLVVSFLVLVNGCGSSNGCPNGYEPVMGMCVEVGTRADAWRADGGSSDPDAWTAIDAGVGDAGSVVSLDDAGLPVDDAPIAMPDAFVPDAFVVPDAGCPFAVLYVDADGDGFGDATRPLSECASSRAGYVRDATDCSDTCASCRPGGSETCNGADDDCDGAVDDGVMLSFYVDADGDGFGTGTAVSACTAPSGHSATTGDCNDACASCRPGGVETCNGADDDCDGTVDDGVTTTFYVDADSDTYGRSDMTTQACTLPAGHASRPGDCDDTSATSNPSAVESCDGRDNDCDASIDDGVLITFYRDGDNDTFGRSDMTLQACTPPSGYVGVGGDCNDASMSVRPSAPETCNDVDDDCDGVVDDGLTTATYYADCDRDGFTRSGATTTVSCRAPTTAPSVCSGGQWLSAPSAVADCVDENASVFPGQTAFFTSVIVPTQPTGREYDYDCSGGVTQQYPRSATGSCGSCDIDGATGWSGSVRACGFGGTYLSCTLNPGFGCRSTSTTRTQACR